MYPLNKPQRLSVSISVFCMFLSACGGQGDQATPPELSNKTEVSTASNKKSSVINLDTLKAFPTAEGAGAGATGGRGGKVVYVTNTNEKGRGSLFEAVTGYGNEKRTIVFAVGGRFNVSDWNWKENVGNFTLAGQTAHNLGGVHIISIPYHDIGFKYEYATHPNPNGSIYITHSDNMNIRFISAKGGFESGIDAGNKFVAFNTMYSNNFIYDHCSTGFSTYHNNLGGFNQYTNKHGGYTVQYALGHENYANQNVGYVLGSYYSKTPAGMWDNNMGEVDFHHNAYILNTHRHTGNIYAGKSSRYRRISNYIYGVGGRLDSFVGDMSVDYVNNIYESDRSGDIGLDDLFKFEVSNEGKEPTSRAMEPSLYFKGNEVIKQNGTPLISQTDNQWLFMSNAMAIYGGMGSAYDGSPLEGASSGDSLPDIPLYHRTSKIADGNYPVTVTPTKLVKSHVLENAGAGVRFNQDGSTYNVDSIDSYYLNIARKSVGPTYSSSYLGDGGIGDPVRFSFPKYSGKSLDLDKFDSDRNGLPDDWEAKHEVSDANGVKENWSIQGYTIKNKAGYTNLEMYLAELAGDFHMLAKK